MSQAELADFAIVSIKEPCKKMNRHLYEVIWKMATDVLASGSSSNNPKVPPYEE